MIPPPPPPYRPSCDLHPEEKFNGFCPSCLYDRLSTLHPATSSLFRRTKSFSSSNNVLSSVEPHRRSCDVRVGVTHNTGGLVRARAEGIGPIEEQSRIHVLANAGRAGNLIHDVGSQAIRARVEGIGPINVSGRAQTLNHDVGSEGIRPRVLNEVGRAQIRARVEGIGPIEEQITALDNVGGAQNLNHDVGIEGIRARVSNEVGRDKTLVDNVGEIRVLNEVGSEIRAFDDPIEGEARVRVSMRDGRAQALVPNRGSTEISRDRTLGGNVGDEISAFEDPIEGEARVSPKDSRPKSNVGEIRVSEDSISTDKAESSIRVPIDARRARTLAGNVGEEEIAVEDEMKRMRDYIDLDFQAKKKKPAVGFWSAASVFSKKWNKWMKKQKAKKQSSELDKTVLPIEKPIHRQYRETQSELADYGFGRRSCDTDPRFSIDIGRYSVDGPRPSFDPPRASWDGHMARRSNYSDHRVPLVEPIPGDTIQTHQYYLDTSSRRRRSFDRSGSKRGSLVNNSEVDEMMVGANAKVTPETFDFHQRKSTSNSLRDECSEIFELGIRDDGSVIGNVEKGTRKSGRWGKKWSFWGLINGRNNNKYDEDDRYSRRNGLDRSSSVRANDGNMYRRTSSVSLASSNTIGGLGGHVRNPSIGENGYGRKKRDELVLERNRSVDNGLLRFYLTPPRSNNRISGPRKSCSNADKSHSINKGVYRY